MKGASVHYSRNRFYFLGLFTVLAASTLVAAPQEKDKDKDKDDKVKVLVSFRGRPGPSEQVALESAGGSVTKAFTLVNAVAARLPKGAVEAMKRHPLVNLVEEDVEIQAHDVELDNTWGVKAMGAGLVHDGGNKGTGVKVCVIDTGIDTNHPDLYQNYKGGYDFVNGDSDPADDNGHGTHVAGTIAAMMNGLNVRGAAPQAELYVYKVLSASGSGSFSSVIGALQECVRVGGKVTNSSFGSSSDPGLSVRNAYANAMAAGVVNIASAGNSGAGTNTVGFPGQFESVVAVAASDSGNNRAGFSSTGPAVAITAPGVGIPSTYLNDGYAGMSGTSMASPHVAGAAALVIACGITSPTAVRDKLMSTALDMGPAGRDNEYGAGIVRVNLAASNCSNTPSPLTDLSVTGVTTPTSATVNTGVTISVPVSNSGNQTASGFRVALRANNVYVSELAVPSLTAGQSTTLNFPWSASTTGVYTLQAALTTTDGSTGNNSASATIQITQPSVVDLALTGLSAPGSINSNTSTTVSVPVSNTGNQTASGYTVTLRDNGAQVGQVAVPTLNVGQSTTLNFSWNSGAAGTHTLQASLSPTDGNANNNTSTASVSVTQPAGATPPPPTDSPASSITISATPYRSGSNRYVSVSWNGATTQYVTVRRTGPTSAAITTVNDRQYTDTLAKRSSGTFTYVVCEANTTNCSQPVSVTF